MLGLSNIFAFIYILFGVIGVTVEGNSDAQSSNIKAYEGYTDRSLLWGPYRSNCYFGMRPRNIKQSPLIIGAMWFDSTDREGLRNVRHLVSQEDKMNKYSWEIYDPRLGGKEVLIDERNNLNITFTFVKSRNGKNWAVRVNGQPLDASKSTTASVIIYMNQNGEDGVSKIMRVDTNNANEDPNNLKFFGTSKELGNYELSINDNYGKYYVNRSLKTMEIIPGCDCSKTSHVSFRVPDAEVWRARDIFQSFITDSINQLAKSDSADIHPSLIPSLVTIRNVHNFPPGNFQFIQKTFDNTVTDGFEFDIIYNAAKAQQKIESKADVSSLISWSFNEIKTKFDKKFTFQGEAQKYKSFALETLSNLLGGISYFHGSQMVDRTTQLKEDSFEKIEYNHAVEESPLELFSSVPSRAFFPRGFYWDEGFQVLQIMEYDFDLAFEIITSWFNLIEDETGWVAREVILGNEARSKVPPEFTVQSPNIANPPTLLLTFSEMLTRAIDYQNSNSYIYHGKKSDSNAAQASNNQLEENADLLIEYAKKIYPKLLKHYEWFRTSQKGMFDEYEEIFEDEGILGKVHEEELYRWAGRTKDHCLPSGLDDYPRPSPPDMAELHVDALAWVGVMTRSMKQIAHILNLTEDEKKYETIENNIVENLDLIHWSENDKTYCDVTVSDYDDVKVHVCHQGYISLLPFALKLMPKDSPKLKDVISLMSDKEKLFSEYGLRSLSKSDEYYGKGEDYWRGKIWMNINYLALDAMRHYYPELVTSSKSKDKQVSELYNNLKSKLITNVYDVWEKQGFCYENYSPTDGHGSGAEQFTGWTALIVNIMGRF